MRSKTQLGKSLEHYWRMYERIKQPSRGKPTVHPQLSKAQLWTYLDKTTIQKVLPEARDKRFNWENLNKVFQICYHWGIGKDNFYLGINGHGIDSGVFHRNMKRLMKLKIIEVITKGIKYDKGNIINKETNQASIYALTLPSFVARMPLDQPEPVYTYPEVWMAWVMLYNSTQYRWCLQKRVLKK